MRQPQGFYGEMGGGDRRTPRCLWAYCVCRHPVSNGVKSLTCEAFLWPPHVCFETKTPTHPQCTPKGKERKGKECSIRIRNFRVKPIFEKNLQCRGYQLTALGSVSYCQRSADLHGLPALQQTDKKSHTGTKSSTVRS